MGKFFQTTAFIIAIGGLIYGIILGAVCQYNAGSSWNTDYKFNIGLMFQTWIFSDIIALAFFLGAHLLDALERIEKSLNGAINKKQDGFFIGDSLKDIIKFTNKLNAQSNEESKTNNNASFWYCPKCGTKNSMDNTTCKCGTANPKTH